MFEHRITIGKALDKGVTAMFKTKPGQIPYPDESQLWELVTVIELPNKKELQYFWKKKIQ